MSAPQFYNNLSSAESILWGFRGGASVPYLERIGLHYPLDTGKRSEQSYLEAVWKELLKILPDVKLPQQMTRNNILFRL